MGPGSTPLDPLQEESDTATGSQARRQWEGHRGRSFFGLGVFGVWGVGALERP